MGPRWGIDVRVLTASEVFARAALKSEAHGRQGSELRPHQSASQRYLYIHVLSDESVILLH
eukprot:COSAG02_NODE_832_length_16660_cov_16.228006_12_plen_61_part_00